MPRHALALVAVFSLIATSAIGQAIQFEGSVQPVAPVGFPPVGGSDSNNDGVIDFLSTGGNGIITTGISQTDPTGLSGNGLPWNATRIYRNYETAQNILVADLQQSGRLAITAGGTLRYQHLVIGGTSERIDPANGLDVGLDPIEFMLADIDALAVTEGGGNGVVTVSGFGSLFSNDPNVIDPNVQTALILAAGGDPNIDEPIVDLEMALNPTNYPFPTLPTFREANGTEQNDSFDVIVGLNSSGALNVEAGGRVEIRDALMTGIGSRANGTVSVDGVGSTLIAYGRFDLDFNGTTLDPQRSVMSTSFIGGRGTGVMTVSNGGRAEFFNGLSIGAPIGVVETIDEGNGSGTVTVTGPGSFINVASSAATDLESGGAPIALAVGQLRDALTDTFDPTNPDDANLQSGVLVIEDNAVVTTTAGFGDMLDDANAAIGKRGEVTLAGGELQVGSNLDNDGQINGFGLLRARTMDTSIFSVIRGGNPNSENFEIADPLRLVLLDASDDVMDPALTNRGLIEGRVNFEVSGTIVNEGQIETSGEIFANQLFTEVESRVRQAPGTDSPLRLRLSGTNAAGEASGNNNFGALHNRGDIEGELDFVVQGGVVNGDNLLPQPGSGSSVSGVIRGSGRILAGTFINHSDAEIRVRAGESLSILSNDTGTTTLPAGDGFPVAAGTNVIYRSMNLGSISVTDGELEIGYLPQSGGPFTPPVLTAGLTADAANFFINARYAEIDPGDPTVPNSAGTITANGGTLGFSTGIINFGGVMAFVGGDNIVNGRVINASPTFGSGGNTSTIPGAIIVTGDGTTVTFEDDVINDGEILVGPFDNVANFLGNLTNNGTIAVAFDSFGFSTRGAVITVSGGVNINGGTIDIGFLNAPDTMDTDISIALLTAGDLAEDSLFTELILPDLAEGQFWDIVYDTANDEVRLEIVESNAFGADFTGDGIVSQDDVDVWIRNAGIVAGASTIQGDADLDGDVDLADYNVLMEQLFTGVPELVTGAVAFGQGIVPEPGTALLLCLAAATAGVTRRR